MIADPPPRPPPTAGVALAVAPAGGAEAAAVWDALQGASVWDLVVSAIHLRPPDAPLGSGAAAEAAAAGAGAGAACAAELVVPETALVVSSTLPYRCGIFCYYEPDGRDGRPPHARAPPFVFVPARAVQRMPGELGWARIAYAPSTVLGLGAGEVRRVAATQASCCDAHVEWSHRCVAAARCCVRSTSCAAPSTPSRCEQSWEQTCEQRF